MNECTVILQGLLSGDLLQRTSPVVLSPPGLLSIPSGEGIVTQRLWLLLCLAQGSMSSLRGHVLLCGRGVILPGLSAISATW